MTPAGRHGAVMRWQCRVLLAAALTAASGPAVTGPAAAKKPVVAAQMYVWVQEYQSKGEKLEDHLDEAFAATQQAGYGAIQGWLSWFASPEIADKTTTALAAHHLVMLAGYTDGPMHDDRAAATIDRVVEWAARARQHGVATVIMNPDVRKDRAEKTDDELAVQAANLDRLGARLRALGMALAIHAHDPEMRSGAREWYSNLRRTRPENVGICLDIDWVYRGGQDPIAMIKAAGSRLRDVHLRASDHRVWIEDLAAGDVDYAQIARALRAVKFTGTYTVELAYEKGTVRTRSVEEDLARSRTFTRKVFGL